MLISYDSVSTNVKSFTIVYVNCAKRTRNEITLLERMERMYVDSCLYEW